MGFVIFEGLSTILAPSILGDLYNILSSILGYALTFFTTSAGAKYIFAAVGGIGGAMLLIYYTIDVFSLMQRDMLSLDKFILATLKLLLAIILIANLQGLITVTLTAGQGAITAVKNDFASTSTSVDGGTIQYSFGDTVIQEEDAASEFTWDNMKDSFTKRYDPFLITDRLKWLGLTIKCGLLWIIQAVTQGFVYFYMLSAAALLSVRAMMAPMAVANCFDGEARSQGIRYLKHFAAAAIQFSLVMLVVVAADWLAKKAVLSSVNETLTFDNLDDALSGGLFIKVVSCKLAAIGGIKKVGDLAGDIMGTKPI